jgi:mgtE-like transporter
MTELVRVIRESLAILVLCALLDFLAGGTLEGMKENFSLLPGLLVMIPPLVDLRGNIGSALGSRLGSALHLGLVRPKFVMTDVLKANIFSSLILSVLASATIGIMSWILCFLMSLSGVSFSCLLFIAVFSGVLSGVIITFLTVFISILSFKKGWDPDVVTGPIITTLGDIVTTLSILLAVIVW